MERLLSSGRNEREAVYFSFRLSVGTNAKSAHSAIVRAGLRMVPGSCSLVPLFRPVACFTRCTWALLMGHPRKEVQAEFLSRFVTVESIAWHPDGQRISLWAVVAVGELGVLDSSFGKRFPTEV